MAYRQIYAAYKGDDNLADGTAEELAQKLGIGVDTLYCLASPSNHKRNKGNKIIIIKLGREEVDNE